MIFELVPYKKILDKKFVNENLMPFNENEQIARFHATVWANALLKNPYSKEVYWGDGVMNLSHSMTHARAVLTQRLITI